MTERSERLRHLRWIAGSMLLATVVAGTILTHTFMAAYEGHPIPWTSALLFVIETITTVGYGEFLPFQSDAMRWTSIGLMVLGITLVFFLGATLVARWVEDRIAPRPPTASGLRNHLILTDHNSLVREFAEALRALDVPLLFLIGDPDRALELRSRGWNVVLGDPDDPEALERANLDWARGVVACGTDADNIGAILAAKSVLDIPVVALVERRENARFPRRAGADAVVSPKEAMGRGLVDWTLAVPTPADWPPPILVEPGAEVIRELNPSVFYITEGSPLAELTLGEVGRRTDALIVGLWRGDELILNPSPSEDVVGTALIALGLREQVGDLARQASDGDGSGRYVVVGCGDVGGEAADRLRRAGVDPTVVDVAEVDVPNLVRGDATTLGVLEAANVGSATTLILALNDDNANLQVALEARFLNPHVHISARVIHAAALRKFVWAGVEHAVSMPTVAARMLMQALVRQEVLHPLYDVAAVRRPAGTLAGSDLRSGDIRRRTGCLVVGLVVEGVVRPAHGTDRVPEGAELLLLGSWREVASYEATFLGGGSVRGAGPVSTPP